MFSKIGPPAKRLSALHALEVFYIFVVDIVMLFELIPSYSFVRAFIALEFFLPQVYHPDVCS